MFLILNRIEITEAFAPDGAKPKQSEIAFLEPEVCEGLLALDAKLHDLMPLRRRTAIVLEITAIAQAVTQWLEAAPLVARGRPRRQT